MAFVATVQARMSAPFPLPTTLPSWQVGLVALVCAIGVLRILLWVRVPTVRRGGRLVKEGRLRLRALSHFPSPLPPSLPQPFRLVLPLNVAETAAAVTFSPSLYPNLPKKIVVTGGAGFLGMNVVRALLAQPASVVQRVVIFDLRKPAQMPADLAEAIEAGRVVFETGNLVDTEALRGVLLRHGAAGGKKAGGKGGASSSSSSAASADEPVGAVIHTAAPHPNSPNKQLFVDVNITGTSAVIAACKAASVPVLIYTSSASVVWEGTPHDGVGEEVPYPTSFRDYYASTKAEAERRVMAAGGTDELITISLRPHAIFGPGDLQMVPTLVDLARKKKNVFVVGDGYNLVDFTYVGNVVHAHLQAVQAAHKFLAGGGAGGDAAPAPASKGRRKSVSSSSSSSAPRGASAFPANGKAYFITNGEPVPFWSFMNGMWLGLGYSSAYLRIPYSFILAVAHVAQAVAGVVGKIRGKDVELQLSPSRLQISGTVHYYSIANAVRDLGYRPLWTLDQGVFLTLKAFAASANDKPLAPATVKNARDGNLFSLGLLKDPKA